MTGRELTLLRLQDLWQSYIAEQESAIADCQENIATAQAWLRKLDAGILEMS